MEKEEHGLNPLDEIGRIVQETLRDYHVTVYVFGSWATGKVHRASDIDIVIGADESIHRGLLASLRERLEESRVPYSVDVVLLDEVDEVLKRRILSEGILWKG